jgi:hypothetical protein
MIILPSFEFEHPLSQKMESGRTTQSDFSSCLTGAGNGVSDPNFSVKIFQFFLNLIPVGF